MNLTGFHRAKVLDNNDPEHRGRIKVEVYPYLVGKVSASALKLDGIELAYLPWATPAFGLFSGAGVGDNGGYGSFCVPEVNSFVFVFFEANDIYSIVYFAEAQTKVHGIPDEAELDYPYTKVWKTKGGISIVINDNPDDEYLQITHPSGTTVLISDAGNVTITSVNDVAITAENDIEISAGGDINITSGGNVNINP